MATSQIDIESIEDKSKIAMFVKHPKKISLKECLPKNSVIFVRNALRKISNKIDIYTQL